MRIWRLSIGLKTVALIAALIMAVSIGTFALATSSTVSSNTSSAESCQQLPNYVGSIKVNQYDNLSEGQEAKILQGMAKITPAQAKSAALSKVNGSATKISLDNENGYLVYSVGVKTSNGIIKDVKVDAGDGKVLYIDNGSDVGKESPESSAEKENTNELKEENSGEVADSDSVNEEVQQGGEN